MSEISLTPDAWNQLLRALDPDAAQAASRYEQLRSRLIELYRWRALPCPEDLADAALDQVACHLMRGAAVSGAIGGATAGAEVDPVDPVLRDAARQIAAEAGRRRRRERTIDPAAALPRPAEAGDGDDPLGRLCRCLEELPAGERRTLLEYETGAGHERIRRRKALAADLGIPMNALRVRVHRLRARLFAMMRAEGAPGAKPAAPRREDAKLTAAAAAAAGPLQAPPAVLEPAMIDAA